MVHNDNNPTKKTQEKVLQLITFYFLYNPIKAINGILLKELKQEIYDTFNYITKLSYKRKNELINFSINSLLQNNFIIRDKITKDMFKLNIEGVLKAYYKNFSITSNLEKKKLEDLWLVLPIKDFSSFISEKNIFNLSSTNEVMQLIIIDRILIFSELGKKLTKSKDILTSDTNVFNFFYALSESEGTEILLLLNILLARFKNQMNSIEKENVFIQLFLTMIDSIKDNPNEFFKTTIDKFKLN